MAKKRILISVDENLYETIDKISNLLGHSKAGFITAVLDHNLDRLLDLEMDLSRGMQLDIYDWFQKQKK